MPQVCLFFSFERCSLKALQRNVLMRFWVSHRLKFVWEVVEFWLTALNCCFTKDLQFESKMSLRCSSDDIFQGNFYLKSLKDVLLKGKEFYSQTFQIYESLRCWTFTALETQKVFITFPDCLFFRFSLEPRFMVNWTFCWAIKHFWNNNNPIYLLNKATRGHFSISFHHAWAHHFWQKKIF